MLPRLTLRSVGWPQIVFAFNVVALTFFASSYLLLSGTMEKRSSLHPLILISMNAQVMQLITFVESPDGDAATTIALPTIANLESRADYAASKDMADQLRRAIARADVLGALSPETRNAAAKAGPTCLRSVKDFMACSTSKNDDKVNHFVIGNAESELLKNRILQSGILGRAQAIAAAEANDTLYTTDLVTSGLSTSAMFLMTPLFIPLDGLFGTKLIHWVLIGLIGGIGLYVSMIRFEKTE